MEVRHEVLVRLHGDDLPFLRPDLLEQRESSSLRRSDGSVSSSQKLEVAEQRLGAVDAGSAGAPRRWTSSSIAWRRITY